MVMEGLLLNERFIPRVYRCAMELTNLHLDWMSVTFWQLLHEPFIGCNVLYTAYVFW